MSAMITADWFHLDKDTYYRKFDLYNMNWNHGETLDSMMLSGAPYGGPIALIRDRKQLVRVVGTAKPIIHIYNCAGTPIAKIVWNSGALINFGWSDSEHLLCIQDSGDVLVYDMFGAYQRTFSLRHEARDIKVLNAQLFPSPQGVGLALMTTSNRMFLMNNVEKPKLRAIPDIPRATERPVSWCVLSSTSSVTGFLVCRDKDIYRCQVGEDRAILLKIDMINPYTQILNTVISMNGRHIAMYTDSGILWLGSSDLRTKYCEVDTGYVKQPKELMWCGTEAVIGHWDNMLVIFGKSGNSINYSYDMQFHLIPEIDCVRVVSETTHELVQKVPLVVQKIFRINSMEPGSYLVEASKQFQKRSHRADEYICLVKPQLTTAVQQCIDAASFEFEPDVQKMLIRAAQFGKGFIQDHNPDHYVYTCRWLRVLNAVRDPKVAIPLTYLQVKNLTERVLLDRLVWRRLHCLAGHIAAYLKLKEGQTRVLSHWACYKVTQPHLDNESMAREIGDKLRNVPGVSYTDIAMKAVEKGRQALATKILEYEPRTRRQVPLLLTMGENRPALLKATASGDTDLVYTVLLHLKEKMAKHDFQLAIRSFPLAHALYVKYCAAYDREALKKVYNQEDDYIGQAAVSIKESMEADNDTNTEAALMTAKEAYKKAKNDLGVSICDDTRKLCKQQASLRETYGENFRGLSLHDTVEKLLLKGEVKLADRLRSEYKMPDRRYWWLRILTLAAKDKWPELHNFAVTKKSPFGFEPFVDACLKYNKPEEALKYLPKCRDDIKVKYYVKAGCFNEAAQVAYDQKDESALLFVQSKCPTTNTSTHSKIVSLMEQLKIRK